MAAGFVDAFIWSDHLREQDGDHAHADSTCAGNADHSLQCYVSTIVPLDNPLHLLSGGARALKPPSLSAEIDRWVRAG